MRILQSWLKEYLPFTYPPEVLAERLGMLGLEIEGIEHLGEKYRGFVVGHVIDVQKHPQADRLTVCTVDVGKEELQIVCGAPNVAPGQKVPVGLVGATVPRNQHDPAGKGFVLSRVNIRGVESRGMICSEYELDLGPDADGIMVLDRKAKTGRPFAAYLGMDDVAYDLEITPNRPDWLSHVGVAREIGVLLRQAPQLPKVTLKESTLPIHRYLSVKVEDKKNCPRFAVRMIRGITVGPSPSWLQNKLRGVGLRPINNIVDITNFVMLECGQPLHAFDYAKLRGGSIIVRRTEDVMPFATLDEKIHQLPRGTVMVCDGEREVSIAGIMGGANSEISETTTDVVLEAASWNPSSIRRASKGLGITSDASQRFERGADPNAIRYALDRAAGLVLEAAGGTLLRGTIDVYPRKVAERLVSLRPARVNHLLGTSLTRREITDMLRLLGIRPARTRKDDTLFRIPTYRIDIEREVDLIEEVARVYGYDRIEVKSSAQIDLAHPFRNGSPVEHVKAKMTGLGYREVITIPLQDAATAKLSGREPAVLLNPLSTEMSTLRTSLVPGLLQVVAHNRSHGNPDLRLFEVGHVYSVDSGERGKLVENYLEEVRLAVVITGRAAPRHWSMDERSVDIFDLKGEVETILGNMGLDKWSLISYSTSNSLADPAISIEINEGYAGYLGRVKEEVRQRFDIGDEVYVAEVDLGSLSSKQERAYKEIARYPRVRRDVAFILNAEVPADEVATVMQTHGGVLLQSVELFDVYQGESLPAGKKSLAFSLDLMSRERTLTDPEIEAAVKAVVEAVTRRFEATLRSVS